MFDCTIFFMIFIRHIKKTHTVCKRIVVNEAIILC